MTSMKKGRNYKEKKHERTFSIREVATMCKVQGLETGITWVTAGSYSSDCRALPRDYKIIRMWEAVWS